MKIVLFLPIYLLLVGCYGVRDSVVTNPLVSQVQEADRGFHTDMSHFLSEFSQVKTKKQRNRLIEELVTASDMECSAYQYRQTDKVPEDDSGYMAMFKIVGKYIGWDIAKDAISAVSLLSDSATKKSNQDKYAQALKPNIIKAVQIARQKYLKKIAHSKTLSIKQYGLEDVKEDIQNYDKRCSTYYGLMEITRALQNQEDVAKEEAKIIDVDEVKVKIKEVTKAVVAKKVWKDTNCTISQELNTSK
jgi:hypothetical protein